MTPTDPDPAATELAPPQTRAECVAWLRARAERFRPCGADGQEYAAVLDDAADELQKERFPVHKQDLAGLRAAAKAVCDPKVQRWAGMWLGKPWHSIPDELLNALAAALAAGEEP